MLFDLRREGYPVGIALVHGPGSSDFDAIHPPSPRLVERFMVQSYPSLFWITYGEALSFHSIIASPHPRKEPKSTVFYSGPRTSQAVFEWISSQVNPSFAVHNEL